MSKLNINVKYDDLSIRQSFDKQTAILDIQSILSFDTRQISSLDTKVNDLQKSVLSNSISIANLASKIIFVKDFGAKGDGITNDTNAVKLALDYANTHQKSVFFDGGKYLIDGGIDINHGVVIRGEGRNSTFILSRLSNPINGYLFNCNGYGSGITDVAFYPSTPQQSGIYVKLSAPESYISDFYMTGFTKGIEMSGNASRIRHGRFADAQAGAIGIDACGGDNSQVIDDVLMGQPNPMNVALAGIRVHNNAALIISKTSVIGMGTGLLIDPSVDLENVFCTFVDNCFFDNNNFNTKITPTGSGGVYRLLFDNTWFGSAHVGNGLTIDALDNAHVKGVIFNNCQFVINKENGVYLGKNLKDISINNSLIAGNKHGVIVNNDIEKLKISINTIGEGADFDANSITGIYIDDDAVVSKSIIMGNILDNVVNYHKGNPNNDILVVNNVGI